MKKTFLSILFCAVSCYGSEDELESRIPDLGEDDLQEIALLEPSLTYRNPISQEEYLTPIDPILAPRKNPTLAAGLSLLFPGLGQAYLGDYKTASAFIGSAGLFNGLDYSKALKGPYQRANSISNQNFLFYNIYGAYRDARTFNCDFGYSYKMPKEGLGQLILAPFQWGVIKKPEVWGGFLGALVIVSGMGLLFNQNEVPSRLSVIDKKTFPLLAFPVGIGEESFFRGYLQSTLSEVLSPWGGIVLSSLCFGALHLVNTVGMDHDEKRRYYTFGLPLITSFGLYFGWVTHKNNSLKESVALHSWYDFTMFLISNSVAHSAAIRKPSLALSLSF